IVPPRRLDAEPEAGQQAAQHLDHGREAAALVTFGAAERQQRAALAERFWVGGLPPLAVDDPAGRDFLAPRDRELDLSCRYRGGGHIQIKRRLEIRRHRDRDRIGAEPRLAAAERRDVLWRAPGIR